MRAISILALSVLAASAAFTLGCAAKKEAEAPPATAARAAAKGDLMASEDGIRTGGLRISEEIVRACGLEVTPAPPMFEFDSAALAEQDRALLADVARCFSVGPLRDKGVALIGRADPRGEGEYNMVLGESRADSVLRFLHEMGVSPHKMKATSRGEMDAIGIDEEGWARDRRVDIELASR